MTVRIASLCVLLAVSSPAVAAGQSAWTDPDPLGAPIIAVQTPELTPGHIYRFETYDLHRPAIDAWGPWAPDSVLTIRASNAVNVGSLAGSDGCEDPVTHTVELQRSCANFRPLPTLPPSRFFVWVRAMSPWTAGVASVRFRDVTADEPFQDLVREAHFGGHLVHGLGPATGIVQIETAELPGSTDSAHEILLALDNTDRNVNWFVGFRFAGDGFRTGSGGLASHRSFVRGTAQYTGPLVPPTHPGDRPIDDILVAPLPASGTLEPYQVIRNDCVRTPPLFSCSLATDADQDGLGDELERWLGTCDRPTDPDAFGVSCSRRFGCDDPAACNQGSSLRDTDGDGWRDDLELYGFQFWTGGIPDRSRMNFAEGGHFPRYGASPAHYDVFVDYNYLDHDPSTALCDPPPVIQAQRDGVAGIYRGDLPGDDPSVPPELVATGTSTIRNRDGTRGIHLHVDTYDVAAPRYLASDFSAGDWGGSSPCSEEPRTRDDCEAVGGAFDDSMSVCSNFDRRMWFTGDSRWLWRTAADRGPSGARNFFGDYYVSSGGSDVFAHEMGHIGWLTHGGPIGARVRAHDRLNGSAGQLSRMSYAFDHTAASDHIVTFNEGGHTTLHARGVSERCPFGEDPLAYRRLALASRTFFFRHDDTVQFPVGPGCPNVDWDLDGTIATGLVEAPVQSLFDHIERGAYRNRDADTDHPDQFFLSEAGSSLVLSGGRLIRLQIEAFGPGFVPEIRMNSTSTFTCSEDPQPSGERYPDCGFDGSEETLFLATRPQALTATDVVDDGIAAILVVWVEDDTRMFWAVLDAAGLRPRGFGEILNHAPLASVVSLDGIPAVARVGGSSEISLVYRNSDVPEGVSEQVAHFDGPGHLFWASPRTVFVAPTGQRLTGAVAATAVDVPALGGPGAMLLVNTGVLVSDSARFHVLRRTGVGGWSEVGAIPAQLYQVGAPTMALRRYAADGVDRWRLVATYRYGTLAAGEVIYMESNYEDLSTWHTDPFLQNQAVPDIRSVTSVAMTFDERTGLAPGLRGAYNQVVTCPSGTAIGAACPTPGTVCVRLDGDQPLVDLTTTVGVCSVPGTRLIQAIDLTLPGADGVVPMGHESFDEWATLQAGYCPGVAPADVVPMIPSAYAFQDTCPPLPNL